METKIEKERKKVVFKEYDQSQAILMPIQIGELIPPGHLVRIVNEVVEGIGIEELERYYKGGGTSSYDPRMLIKVWIYGYCEGIYTSRRIAKVLREHVHFMWLSGNQTPNFKTLSDFRGRRMESMVDVVFEAVLKMLLELGYIKMEDLYIDGSKWEANGNRHKHVWAKNTQRYKTGVSERIKELLEKWKELQRSEDKEYGGRDLAEVGEDCVLSVVMTSEMVRTQLVSLQERIKEEVSKQVAADKEKVKKLTSLSKKLDKECEQLKKYECQEAILGDRNSYSKTDPDATMLRMKDEQLLPAYNVQHATANQYIVHYTIEQQGSDSPTLIPHLDKLEERLESLHLPRPANVVADAGYGSEENYADLEQRQMNAYVKYPLWWQEHSGELKKRKFRVENWAYDPKTDGFTCPQNRTLSFTHEKTVQSSNGYDRTVRVYVCSDCTACPFAEECKKSADKARSVSVSPKGEEYKAKAKQLLESEKGIQLRKARNTEVETCFGDLKQNQKHRRFLLRGRKKVYVEYGLLAIAHNIRKTYCQQSGCWKDYYAQRAAKKAKNNQKAA